jgi:hypothetical protein
MSQKPVLYGRLRDAAPIFDIVCDDRLYLGCCEYMVEGAARGENAAELGWTRRELRLPGTSAPETTASGLTPAPPGATGTGRRP